MSCCTNIDHEALGEVGGLVFKRVSAFGQLLRKHNFVLGLKEHQDALRIAAAMPHEKPARIRTAFRSLFCSRMSDWKAFDALFDSHWLGSGMKKATVSASAAQSKQFRSFGVMDQPQSGSGPGPALADQMEIPGGGDIANEAKGKSEGASHQEISTTTDFRKIVDPAELEKAHNAAERLAHLMRARLTRRERARKNGKRLDLRNIIRRNAQNGGVPIDLSFKKRKEKPLRLIVLLDASGSMQNYTAVFTRFIHGVLDSFHEAEAFVFHTHLAHVSDAMKEKNATRAVERMSLMSQGVGGGTRIGECLGTFNQWHARRVLNSRSCVMILSDGYETGNTDRLVQELIRLRRRCRRLVWLNPMMGWDDYTPAARGIQAALPFVDLMAPAHNLESLAALEPELARI
jgi:uncharacterized protein